MRKTIAIILTLLMILSTVFVLGSCSKKEEPAAEETVEASTDESADKNEESESKDGTSADGADIVKKLEPDTEENLGKDIPLQIESVVLYKDGSVKLVPTDNLKENELGESETDSLMPFSESGKEEESSDAKTGVVKDIYLMKIGNGGYRTIVALMENGTLAAINPRALIEDHIVAVKDNLGGRDSFTDVEQEETEDGFSIIGKTEEGDDVRLDPVILTEEDEEPEQVEQTESAEQ